MSKTSQKRRLSCLSDRLLSVFGKMDEERADLDDEKYQLCVTVWLLKSAAWQGPRQDTMSFATLKEARDCKALIDEMISQQKRSVKGKVKQVSPGAEELDFWDKYMHTTNFQLWWETGDIWHHKREKVTA